MPAEPLLNFIAGQFVPSADTRVRSHSNPSHRQSVVSVIARGSEADARSATAAAAEALKAWRRQTAAARADLLYKWAAAVAANSDRMVAALVDEVGKPVVEARGEVARCTTILRYYAGQAVLPGGDVIPPLAPGSLQFTMREPMGVVAMITPWNFPLAIPLWKTAPALAFGNTVVIKPSEFSGLCASLLAETAAAAGIPAGVFNVVYGEGPVAGAALLRSPEVAAISFTGSHAVGAQVSALAASRNIRCQTEMGGKNIAIVLRDADVGRAASLSAAGGVRYAGQKCTATSRVVVDSAIADEFQAALREKISSMRLGPVTHPEAAIGPLIHEGAREKVRKYLSGVQGGEVIGGEDPAVPDLADGNFVTPALVTGVKADSAVAQEEIFGPVMVMFTADTPEEAITLANGTKFGLSAALFTSNVARALEFVNAIEVGMVRVNGDTTGVDPHAPFGGMKQSSSGTREQGPAARDFYTITKTVQLNP